MKMCFQCKYFFSLSHLYLFSLKAHAQPEGSAAGQLRLMSAQQRTPQPPPPSSSQLTEPQPGIYNQQRRTLGNIDNVGSTARPAMGNTRDTPPAVTSIPVPKSSARTSLTTSTSNSGTAVSQKPQFFAHNPSLRSESLSKVKK